MPDKERHAHRQTASGTSVGAPSLLYRKFVEAAGRSTLVPEELRRPLLRHLGLGLDEEISGICPGSKFITYQTVIGAGTYIGPDCVFDDNEAIRIGSNVFIAARCIITTAAHKIGRPDFRAGELEPSPITIGDGVWIGTGAIVLPGVTIGHGCIIGAGAVVTRDCEPDGVYVGTPAVRSRDLPT